MNRTEIRRAIADKNHKIQELRSEITQLERDFMQLTDEEQQYKEAVEEFAEKVNGKKTKVSKLVGRVYWKEVFTDGDTGKKFSIDRSQAVKVDGEWIV